MEDEPLVASALVSFLRPHGDCRVADSVMEALGFVGKARWTGLVVDLHLPDGDGLDVVERARGIDHRLPVLVLSGSLTSSAINRAAVLGARILAKPCGTRELETFLAEVQDDGDPVGSALAVARKRCHLTPRELDILESFMRREDRAQFLARTRMAESTYKTHVRNLLAKADYESLASWAIDLLTLR